MGKANTSSQNPRLHTGYGYGLSQQATLLAINIPLPATLDINLIDSWLQQSFALTVSPPPPVPAEITDDHPSGLVANLAWRILLLAAQLLREIKVPALDPGRVISVTAPAHSGGLFKITLATPFIDHLSRQVFRQTYQTATRCVLGLAGSPGPARPGHPLADDINQTLITALSPQLPGGISTVPLLATAQNLGIPWRAVGGGVYLLGWGHRAKLVDRSSNQADSAIGAKLSNDKFLSATLIHAAGLPAPHHVLVFSEQEALDAARRLGAPLVVKPVNRDRGEGVTTEIHDEGALLHAVRAAAQLSRAVLVEQQVSGVCHRLYISHGKLLYVVKRLPKSVIGDGVHTVAQLIEQANAVEHAKPPWSRLKPFPSDAMATETLAAAGLQLDSIPEKGQYAPLRRISTVDWGGVVEDLTDTIHPDNVEIAIRAAALYGLSSAGVDLISPDISIPWHRNGAIINEVNFSPMLTNEQHVSTTYLKTLVNNIVEGDGRIPVEVFVGSTALEPAQQRQQELVSQGIACYLTSHTTTLLPDGKERFFTTGSLFDRCSALLLDHAVESIIMVIDNDELAWLGLPVDRLSRVTYVDEQLAEWEADLNRQTDGHRQPLSDLLDSYTLERGAS